MFPLSTWTLGLVKGLPHRTGGPVLSSWTGRWINEGGMSEACTYFREHLTVQSLHAS